MTTSSINSIFNSSLLNKTLVPKFERPCEGDVLRITNKTFCRQLPEGGTVEMFIFENLHGEKIILGLNQILRSRGSVADSFQKAIWQRDIKTGKDIYEILSVKTIRVSHVDCYNVEMPNGFMRKKFVYTFDWCYFASRMLSSLFYLL